MTDKKISELTARDLIGSPDEEFPYAYSGQNYKTTGAQLAGRGSVASPIITNGADWPWYGNTVFPNAFYVSATDTTWVFWEAFIENTKYVCVTTFDHATRAWTPQAIVARAPLQTDNHGVPAAVRDADGYVHVFFGSHATASHHAYSTNPDDPSAWTAGTDLSAPVTYPHPVLVGSTIYVFVRATGIAGLSSLTLFKSASIVSGAVTWAAPVSIGDVSPEIRWYQGTLALSGTDIYMTMTHANGANTIHTDIYVLIYNTVTGGIRNISSTKIIAAGSLPVNLTDLDSFFRVATVTSRTLTAPACNFTDDGYFHLLYNVQATTGDATDDLYHTVWNGSTWSAAHLVSSDSLFLLGFDCVKVGNDLRVFYSKSVPNIPLLSNPAVGTDLAWQGYTIRQPITISDDVRIVRVSFTFTASTSGSNLTEAYIGQRGTGSAYDFDGNQVLLYFKGVINPTLPVGTLVSDPVAIPLKASSDLLVAAAFGVAGVTNIATNTNVSGLYEFKGGNDAATTVASGYSAGPNSALVTAAIGIVQPVQNLCVAQRDSAGVWGSEIMLQEGDSVPFGDRFFGLMPISVWSGRSELEMLWAEIHSNENAVNGLSPISQGTDPLGQLRAWAWGEGGYIAGSRTERQVPQLSATWPETAATMYALTTDNTGITEWTAATALTVAGGTNTQVQYNAAGVLGGMGGTAWDNTNRSLTMTGATVTTSHPVFDLSQTWNAAATFNGISLAITDTSSTKPSNFLKMVDASNGTGILFGKYGATIPGIWLTRTGETQSISNYNFLNDVGSNGMILNHGSQFQFWIADSLNMAAAGSDGFRIAGGVTSYIGFTPGAPYNTAGDTRLSRDAADCLAQRRTTTAQNFRVYNTFTDTSNFERGVLDWQTTSNVLTIGTQKLGTGTLREVLLMSNSRWMFNGTTSSFTALKPSTTTLITRLADDSNDANAQSQLSWMSQTINIATTIPAAYSSYMPEVLTIAAGIDFELGAGAIMEIGG